MFDDGEAEAGAAHLFGVALVYAVEALEDPVQVLFGNPDPAVPDSQDRFAGKVLYPYIDAAA